MIEVNKNSLEEFLKNKSTSSAVSSESGQSVAGALKESTGKLRDWIDLAREIKELVNSPIVQSMVNVNNQRKAEGVEYGQIVTGQAESNTDSLKAGDKVRDSTGETENKAGAQAMEKTETVSQETKREIFSRVGEKLSFLLVGQLGFTIEAILKENPDVKLSEIYKDLEDNKDKVRAQILTSIKNFEAEGVESDKNEK